MFLRRLTSTSLFLLIAFTPAAHAEVANTSNRPDLVAVSVDIDDSGSIVAVIANQGLAVTAPFVAEIHLDGNTRRILSFAGSDRTRGATRGASLEPSTLMFIEQTAGQDTIRVPQNYLGKWRGISGKGEANLRQQTGRAVVIRDLGHIIDEFEFEVAEDGTITGSGKATYWFNVSSQADLIVTRIGPTAYLEGGTQTLDFKIEGKMTPEGKVQLRAVPQGDLNLINAGNRQTIGAWNVFGPYEEQVRAEGCKPFVESSRMIEKIGMKLAWKAEKKCGVDCRVDRIESVNGQTRKSKVELVVLHSTGGVDDGCDPKKFFKSGTLQGIVNHFKASGGNPSIHYIIGRDGTVVRMVPEDQVANHVYKGNAKLIGIELINNGDGKDPYPLDQLNALAELVAEILCRHGLNSSNIKGHGELDTRQIDCQNIPYAGPRRVDPGSNFPWEWLRTRVDALLQEDR